MLQIQCGFVPGEEKKKIMEKVYFYQRCDWITKNKPQLNVSLLNHLALTRISNMWLIAAVKNCTHAVYINTKPALHKMIKHMLLCISPQSLTHI